MQLREKKWKILLSGDVASEDEPVFSDKKRDKGTCNHNLHSMGPTKNNHWLRASLSEVIFSCKPSAASSSGQCTLSLREEEAWNRAPSGWFLLTGWRVMSHPKLPRTTGNWSEPSVSWVILSCYVIFALFGSKFCFDWSACKFARAYKCTFIMTRKLPIIIMIIIIIIIQLY